MKRILTIILMTAIFSACTSSLVEYDVLDEIGFTVAAGNMTKAAAAGTSLPSDLNMFVFAETHDNSESLANYLVNAEFKNKGNYKWGGWKNNTAYPYYWPNVKTLHFAGYTKSGNATNGAYDCTTGTFTISNYSPGTSTGAGENDLMWFPSTKLTRSAGYAKSDEVVPVKMFHTCAWISFVVVGDQVTGSGSNDFKVTEMTMIGVDQTADLTCSAKYVDNKVVPTIIWKNNSDQTGDNTTYTVPVKAGGAQLQTTGVNVETGATSTNSGNVVLIPQKPGTMNLAYTYTNPAGTVVTDHVSGLDLSISKVDADDFWQPGRHYIYTIEIRVDKINVVPTLDQTWTYIDGGEDLSTK